MKRRALLFAGAGLLVVPAAALSQTPKLRRIAFLSPGSARGPGLDIVRRVLKELGYVEDRDYLLEAVWAENKPERLPALAVELVKRKPDVILTGSSAGVAACQKATSTIPIVFATAGRPVEQGFVSSLRRPGGNITGAMLHNLTPKVVEAAREAFPQMRRLAMVTHESDPIHKMHLESFLGAVPKFNLDPIVVRLQQKDDFPRAFRELAERKAQALIAPDEAIHRANAGELAKRALQARMPLLSTFEEAATAGGLLTYASSIEENFRRALLLVDKILKGANPGDLPVEQPERFVLTINQKTAKLIGVELPPATVLRADKVID